MDALAWQGRILITGANGQLGRALQVELTDPPDHVANSRSEGGKNYRLDLFAHRPRRWRHNLAKALDVTDRAAVGAAISDAKPDIVIHAAAWTDTAGCERDPDRARLVNSDAAGFVAEACREAGAVMLHISSNEVFDGEKRAPYNENDPVNPVNEYGRSKLVGEQAVAAALPEHQIVRTSWLYGPGRVSFPEKILARARADGRLRLVTDEIASPTWTIDLAKAIAALVRKPEFGIFHLANDGECSRKQWGEEIIRLAGIAVPVEETTQAAFNLPYNKPVVSTLANNRAAALGVAMRLWQEALADHMRVTGALAGETARI